ncbi:MAG TPA: hypothetical protein VIU12_19580 [Chryseolinea sp.]
MNAIAHHTPVRSSTWKFLVLGILLMLLAAPSFGQNSKGDRPSRESRFSTPFRKSGGSGPGRKARNKKRIKSSERSSASNAHAFIPHRRASGTDRPGKPIRPIMAPKPRKGGQKAWRGDITGRRIRNRESAGSARNVYPQYGRYTNNPSQRPRSAEHAASNRGTLAKLKKIQGPLPKEGGPKPRIVPRSGSRAFTARKSINVYANFPRPKRRPEQATTRDLAGKPIRKRSPQTSGGRVIAPTFHPYAGRKSRLGDKPYKGPAMGGHRTTMRRGENAWTGDVAGRRVRGRNFTSKKRVEGMPILSKRPRSISGAVYGKARGYQGKTKPRESQVGMPVPPKGPGRSDESIRRYENHTRGRKIQGGGGSVSGGWNNNGKALVQRVPKQGAGIARFQGNIKGHRPDKGGGSVSGRLWNNQGRPLDGTAPRTNGKEARFQGNVRARRPEKGGGSVSGKLWNNKEHAILVRHPKNGGREALFQGNIRGHRPEKGGGSVSGKLWNNNEEPIVSKLPLNDDTQGLQVKVKRRRYVKNKNSADEALLKLKPTDATFQAGELQVKVKQREYGKKPHAAEGAMPGIKPSKATVKASEYARSMKRNWDYVRNPSSSEDALKTREPGKAFARASAYQGNIKMQKFKLFAKNKELHPDTKFIKINKNNVDDERDMLTNFKLWWARLFKKQDTQPDHLKEKGRKPRYDKGEAGMWND